MYNFLSRQFIAEAMEAAVAQMGNEIQEMVAKIQQMEAGGAAKDREIQELKDKVTAQAAVGTAAGARPDALVSKWLRTPSTAKSATGARSPSSSGHTSEL